MKNQIYNDIPDSYIVATKNYFQVCIKSFLYVSKGVLP